MRLLLCLVVFLSVPLAAMSQERRPSHCIAIADADPGLRYLHKAKLGDPLEEFTVRLSYISHASFLLEGAQGFTAVTDYTGFVGSTGFFPTVATMNKAHDTHWTAYPDPRIPHLLRGWNPDGDGPADHYVELGEVLIRNVPTDIRSSFGALVEPLANSIFVFELAGLCIGHLGHLHHEPNEQQYAALGRLDVVMAPVDGGMTVDLPTMIQVVKRLRSSIVLPMHWFGDYTLQSFLSGMSDEFRIDLSHDSFLEVSLKTLPSSPTVVVLRPAYLRDDE